MQPRVLTVRYETLNIRKNEKKDFSPSARRQKQTNVGQQQQQRQQRRRSRREEEEEEEDDNDDHDDVDRRVNFTEK